MIQAVIFDLDGVLTDTAEYHYLAWQKLADEEGLVFNRGINEGLRGVSRADSLRIILDGKRVWTKTFERMMARKNGYYVELISQISPEAILPGVIDVLDELGTFGVKRAVGSASKNAPTIIDRLALARWFEVIADGSSVERSKPEPDLFVYAAKQLGVPVEACVVVEDAAAGIEAAKRAGMKSVGVGESARGGEGWVESLGAQSAKEFRTLIHSL